MELELSSRGTYKQPWSRQRRGLLVFLLDQSGSMNEKVKGQSYTNGHLATSILNQLIVTVINNAPTDAQTGRRKNYCDLIIFGYGDTVTPLLNKAGTVVSVPDLAEHPKDWHQVLVEQYDSRKGKMIQVEEEQAFWIEYFANSSRTETAEAIINTYQVIQKWLEEDTRRRQSFPPVVINITDGMHNGKGNPIEEARKLRELRTNDGQVLFFNCHLTSTNTSRLIFPSNKGQILSLGLSSQDQAGAQQLFDMSSIVPASMIKRAREVFSIALAPSSRGFMYNADGQDLVNFLTWGTRQSREFKES